MDTAEGHAPDAAPDLAHRATGAVLAYREGRTGPLEDLVREGSSLLWHIVRAQGVPREDAEDVVQGVWLAFVRSIDSIEEPGAALKWLVVSARRAAWRAVEGTRRRDRLHRPLPEPGAPEADLQDPAPGPAEPVLDAERDRVLWRQYQELPQRCRELLRFVAVADRPDYRAISEATGISYGSVGITRSRCLAKLRALLEGDLGWAGA